MPSTITADKAALRKSVKEFCLTDFPWADSDDALLSRFLQLPEVGKAPSLLLYYGVDREPDTSRLLEPLTALGKIIALPCCLPDGQMEARRYLGEDRLISGPFGIPQPSPQCPVIPREALSLILVPALCCDEQGFRLGHGGGYYDRYLSGYQGFTLALCRDPLLYPRIPVEPHDLPLRLILTETRCLSSF